jgi:hypothetical protein
VNTKQLLKTIKALLSANERAQLAEYESLEDVLQKLEAKEAKLGEKLADENDEDRRREIERKLQVIAAQRKKGLVLKQELEALRDTD